MCAFHAFQALNRRLQQLGLQTLYQDGGHVRSIIRRIGAIITVPPLYMDEAIIVMFRAIDRIDAPADVKAKLRSLLDYFDNTWVGNHLGKGFLSMLLLGPGTTNHAEGYHSRLRDHFARSHPKLGEWMVTFKELNNHEEEKAAEVLRGDVPPNGPSAGFQVLQQRRLDLRQRFDDFLETDFTSDEFRSECYKYLGRMANLLGINPQNRRERREARAEERARLRAAAALRRVEEEPPAESGPEDNNPSDQSEDEREEASSDESSASSDEENPFE
ncbi:hypothetical protein AAVH_12531 [Aphelenchoides avenae]|nr:hypothetical protein AAVH_12531 [Aphelenchus avenae]